MRSMFREMTTLVIATFSVAACAGAPPRTAAERQVSCPLTQADSAFLSRGPVYRECAVDTKAQLIPTSTRGLNFTPQRNGPNCYAVDLEVVVDTLGKPEVETAHIIRATDRSYADAVLSSVASWRFEAAMLNHRPVRQISQIGQKIAAVAVVVPAGSGPPPPGAGRPVRPPTC
jgi:hypothetical protein